MVRGAVWDAEADRTCSLCVAALAEGLQVTVPDKKKVAMLFQPTLLRCRFSTSSHQPAVVQWKFKSYCQDRMGESLALSSPRAQSLSKRNLEWDPYLDCLDSRRTVRVVASKQGSTVTLGDFYRGREITIVHGNAASAGRLGSGGALSAVLPRHGVLASLSALQPLKTRVLWGTGVSRSLAHCFRGVVRGERVGREISREELQKQPFLSPTSSLRSSLLEWEEIGSGERTSPRSYRAPWRRSGGPFPKLRKQTPSLGEGEGCSPGSS